MRIQKKTGDTRIFGSSCECFPLFIISLFLFASYKNIRLSAQAKKKSIKPIRPEPGVDLDEVYQDGLTAIYAKEYGRGSSRG